MSKAEMPKGKELNMVINSSMGLTKRELENVYSLSLLDGSLGPNDELTAIALRCVPARNW